MSISSRRTLGGLTAAVLLCGGVALAPDPGSAESKSRIARVGAELSLGLLKGDRVAPADSDTSSMRPATDQNRAVRSAVRKSRRQAARKARRLAGRTPATGTSKRLRENWKIRNARRSAAIECGGGALCAAEVEAIVLGAAAAIDSSTMTVAVTDRIGNVLALFRQSGATDENDDIAVGLARTAAFFSNNQAPLSSRTVRFISGVHFPPGIRNAPNAALYGIENTNRGCDFNAEFNPGQAVPQPKSVSGLLNDEPCNGLSQLGCGPGIVTGKVQPFDDNSDAVNPGGVPVFRPRNPLDPGEGQAMSDAFVLGGVGVAGVDLSAAEFAAFSGAFGRGTTAPVPQFPLDPPGNVFVEGVRLPFVNQVSRPSGLGPGDGAGSFVIGPTEGTKDPEGYLVGPRAGSRLSAEQVDRIVMDAKATADRTRAVIRLPLGSRARMVIAVADLNGDILALFRMDDSTIFSIDVAVAKSRNVIYFSGSPDSPNDLPGVPVGTAVTNRTISYGAQPFFPPGIDDSGTGPFFDLFLSDLANPCSQGQQAPNINQTGVVFFPGSVPLYSGGELVGGLGVSGDGVEQDDYVSFFGAGQNLPAEDIWSNRVFVRGVRLPFLKFPRNPEE